MAYGIAVRPCVLVVRRLPDHDDIYICISVLGRRLSDDDVISGAAAEGYIYKYIHHPGIYVLTVSD
jgi:hypothetical protein